MGEVMVGGVGSGCFEVLEGGGGVDGVPGDYGVGEEGEAFALGGFNWWSQHLVMKEVHGECCGASGGGSCDAGSVVVAWSAVESAA